jgi:DNA-binding response OmpR family regulator
MGLSMADTLLGKNILLVEDDELVAMAVEDVLIYAQAASVEVVGSVKRALEALARGQFDVAIVDISLRGEASWPVAQELRRRAVPYLTVTGYGDMLDNELVTKLLPKPYSMEGLLKAVSELLPDATDAISSTSTHPGSST